MSLAADRIAATPGGVSPGQQPAACALIGESQRAALTLLSNAVLAREPCMALTGEAGLGKTFVLGALVAALAATRIRFQRVGNRNSAPLTIERILSQIGLDHATEAAAIPPERVAAALVPSASGSAQTVLAIEQAETLEPSAVGFLFRLTQKGVAGGLAPQVLFVGRPALWSLLEAQGAAADTSHAMLEPLSDEEAGRYVALKLWHAGKSVGDFPDAADLREVIRSSAGMPARIDAALRSALSRTRARPPPPPSPPPEQAPAAAEPDDIDARTPLVAPSEPPAGGRIAGLLAALVFGLAVCGLAVLGLSLFYRSVPYRSALRPPPPAWPVEPASPAPPSQPDAGTVPVVPPAALPASPTTPPAASPPASGAGALSAATPRLRREFEAFLDRSGPAAARLDPEQRQVLFEQYMAQRQGAAGAANSSPTKPAPPPTPPDLAGARVVIHYQAQSDAAAAEAEQLAAALDGSVRVAETRSVVDVPQRATIRYFFSEDRTAATAVAAVLAARGHAWQLKNFSFYEPRPSRGTLEVWLPQP